jgi:BMFP domain-containing protein YqiC|tara:strand:- start:200 stop:442 length:243 start_codon:yes stop_codon:yes gene_type:complete
MNSPEKILKLISNFVETGILTSQDAKKELINNLKFKRDDLIDKLQLVSRDEYNVLKKIIEKQQKQINQLKKKKTIKAKKS